MSDHATRASHTVPPLPALAIGVLLATALLAAAGMRLAGVDISAPDAPAAATRALNFLDQADGSILVVDAGSKTTVEHIVGQQGFIRGTLRGLARERKRMGIGPEAPFELVARTDGRLTLLDPATGRRVDLESFGPVNAAEFARLIGPAR
ncbi:photosynthetic complex assembly protein PuhC [Rivibacter subsaxonicus]|uniref:Putative photosynthetic complex assembly protein n=1 Tax=Rivibacter subsaxonicus TaxID=457575 RepID=A0A4Q7W1S1_9BURK|nr:photosynthetic complex assembly protein PuhC [Rivibacter subsaxonicus]RZU02868.1 putative photosynthetic complex assembly protein [Rivibacter subsaxonicus]